MGISICPIDVEIILIPTVATNWMFDSTTTHNIIIHYSLFYPCKTPSPWQP